MNVTAKPTPPVEGATIAYRDYAQCPDCGAARIARKGTNVYVCEADCGDEPLAECDIVTEWHETAHEDDRGYLYVIGWNYPEESFL